MMIYHRFHLVHPMGDFNSNVSKVSTTQGQNVTRKDVTAACLFVASKMEDTSKKARDILVIAHHLRNPQNPDINPESPILEEQRRRVLGLERMLLETQSFDFRQRHPQTTLIKFARVLGTSEEITKQAWRISLDSYRTWSPLKVPPHAIALACIKLATILANFDIMIDLSKFQVEEDHFYTALEDVLDLYLHSKGMQLMASTPDEGSLMDIKSGLLQGRISRPSSNGHQAFRVEKPDNLTIIGDRGTCRYILDPGRIEQESQHS